MRAFFEFFNRLPFIHYLANPKFRISLMIIVGALIGYQIFFSGGNPNKIYVKIALYKPFTEISSNLTYESIRNQQDYLDHKTEIDKIRNYCHTVKYDYAKFESRATFLNCLHYEGLSAGDNYWALTAIKLTDIADYDLSSNKILLRYAAPSYLNFSLKDLQDVNFQKEVKPGLFQSNSTVFNYCALMNRHYRDSKVDLTSNYNQVRS